ncbi:RNA polymerase sigma factor [Spirosoma foliorum]|uniref:RNA polymerase sigma factor n=1 Tax=Spirosoma foliorum TaxID=2710596 RepID=A0A7G5GNZ8_9BACT|nr:RNA polymerase sigma factor [Spirosoma foliorum]QMW00590.1 RNA polymerase sigma factor [Spirosoma foliorum]
MPILTDSPDPQLLNQLRAGDNQGFDKLYRQCYLSIEHFVVQNSGNQDEAKDLFQETLLVLLTNLQSPDFQVTSSLKTYVFAISKNLWLKQLKKSARWTSLDDADEVSCFVPPVELETPPSAYESVIAILKKLTIRCQTLLSAIFFTSKQITDIVKDDGYSNLHSAQNQKYKCLQQARKVSKK